ncbi:MAG: type IV pilus modification protein PilV [Nitrospira sp.]|nr:type IV pilus modification protein PilV [Nitrospira sp.]
MSITKARQKIIGAASTLRSPSGFTLIEGMIAAGILAIGVLGLSAMQGIALGWNMSANGMTRATNLAADMMERMEYNRKNVASYGGINTSTSCTVSASSQPMARGDCDQWRNLLAGPYAAGLAGVQGQVIIGPTGPAALNQSSVEVRITWTEAAGPNKTSRSRRLSLTKVVAPE